MRAAVPGDLAACARVFSEARRVAPWLGAASDMPVDFYLETEGERIWVAVDRAGAVVGFASVSLEPEGAFLHHLYVRPARQRRGIGGGLLAAVLRELPRPVELKAVVQNAGARRFYRRFGFVEVERRNDAEPPWVRYRLTTT